MAGIVKKIGKITKYETTDYVGTARMLDLDRAAADEQRRRSPSSRSTAEESQTGEFPAVAPGRRRRRAMTPIARDLVELADDGAKR